jgi:hypothetical protein
MRGARVKKSAGEGWWAARRGETYRSDVAELWCDGCDGRYGRLPGNFYSELRAIGLVLIEERADFTLVRVAEPGRCRWRCVAMMMRVGAAGVGMRLGCGVVMMVRGEFVQAIAEERDAAVEGGQGRGQQFSAKITHVFAIHLRSHLDIKCNLFADCSQLQQAMQTYSSPSIYSI